MERIEVNVLTGEQTIVVMTAEEIAALQAQPSVRPPLLPISDRQFFQQAAFAGIITQAEALAAVQTGAIPAALQSIVDAIADPQQKFAAQMILSGATTFERNHPLTQSIGAALGWTEDQIDEFFRSAAAL
jgi:hypothetical protein